MSTQGGRNSPMTRRISHHKPDTAVGAACVPMPVPLPAQEICWQGQGKPPVTRSGASMDTSRLGMAVLTLCHS